MELDLSELDAIVLDQEIGAAIRRGPFLLALEKFVDLLNSGMARDVDLNNLTHQGSKDYFHISSYKGIGFLSYGPNQIYDE